MCPIKYTDSWYSKKNWLNRVANSSLNQLKKKRILLVEDDPAVQLVHSAMLISLGCKLDTASSGKEALKIAEKQDYNSIFLDIGLPDISGIEVARKLRLLERHAHTQLIILAVYSENTSKECLLAGIETVLSNPTSIEEFKTTICKVAK